MNKVPDSQPRAHPPHGDAEPIRDAAQGAGGNVDPSVLTVLTALLRRPTLVFGAPAAFLALALGLALLRPAEYSATAQFGPQAADRSMSQLAGLAAQLGFDLGGRSSMESPEFYAELLRSEHLLRQVVETEYKLPVGSSDTDATRRNLIQIYQVEGRTTQDRIWSAIEILKRRMSVAVSPQSELVTVEVRARTPELAVQITRRMLELVNEFNVSRRQSQAALESEFIAGRVAEAKADLEAAEARLKDFLQRNRAFENSPELSVEYARLQRRVDLQLQVYTSLAQALESSRIAAVRSTPVITIVQPPEDSVRRVRRHLVRNALLGLVLGTGFSISVALGLDYLERQRREEPAAYAELLAAGRSAIARIVPGRGANRITGE